MTQTQPTAHGVLRLFSGLATKPALESAVLPAFRARTGVAVETVYEPTSVLLQLIDSGERFDVLVGVTGSVDALVRQGTVSSVSVRPIARSGIGVACAGAPDPGGFTDVDAFIARLRAARSVAYSRSGASGIYFAELLERLGIREEIDARATVLEKGFTAEALFDGRADLAVQQVSELLAVPGANFLGALPDTVQSFTDFSAGIALGSARLDDAAGLIEAMTDEPATAAFTATGLEPAG